MLTYNSVFAQHHFLNTLLPDNKQAASEFMQLWERPSRRTVVSSARNASAQNKAASQNRNTCVDSIGSTNGRQRLNGSTADAAGDVAITLESFERYYAEVHHCLCACCMCAVCMRACTLVESWQSLSTCWQTIVRT
jgi:hypothetical protein